MSLNSFLDEQTVRKALKRPHYNTRSTPAGKGVVMGDVAKTDDLERRMAPAACDGKGVVWLDFVRVRGYDVLCKADCDCAYQAGPLSDGRNYCLYNEVFCAHMRKYGIRKPESAPRSKTS